MSAQKLADMAGIDRWTNAQINEWEAALHAVIDEAKAEAYREAGGIARRFLDRFTGMDAIKAAGIIGPHTASGAVADELIRIADEAAGGAL